MNVTADKLQQATRRWQVPRASCLGQALLRSRSVCGQRAAGAQGARGSDVRWLEPGGLLG